jgi:hypothetical protein
LVAAACPSDRRLFGSWRRQTFSSSSFFTATLADGLSIHLAVWGRRWLLRHIQIQCLARRRDGEDGLARRLAVGVRALISACFLEDCMYFAVFCLSFRVLFKKCQGVFLMPLFNPFNIYSPLEKKSCEGGEYLNTSITM